MRILKLPLLYEFEKELTEIFNVKDKAHNLKSYSYFFLCLYVIKCKPTTCDCRHSTATCLLNIDVCDVNFIMMHTQLTTLQYVIQYKVSRIDISPISHPSPTPRISPLHLLPEARYILTSLCNSLLNSGGFQIIFCANSSIIFY